MAANPANENKDIVTVTAKHGLGVSTVSVCLQGATVTSWKVAGEEMLFVSKKAVFAKGKAIRGGIPIVFPQFGPGALPQHGFARTSLWKHVSTTYQKGTGDCTLVFELTDNEETRAMWPYSFLLTYTVVLKATSLSMQLQVKNTGDKPFSFTTLLHTYFKVSDADKVTIKGLVGRNYIDKVDGGKEKKEEDLIFRLKGKGEVDRVYKDCNAPLNIGDGGNAEIILMRTGFKDIVVWNPHIEKSKKMADFGDDEWKEMVCVEAGSVAQPITLVPGAQWQGAQGMSITLLDNPHGPQASRM